MWMPPLAHLEGQMLNTNPMITTLAPFDLASRFVYARHELPPEKCQTTPSVGTWHGSDYIRSLPSRWAEVDGVHVSHTTFESGFANAKYPRCRKQLYDLLEHDPNIHECIRMEAVHDVLEEETTMLCAKVSVRADYPKPAPV